MLVRLSPVLLGVLLCLPCAGAWCQLGGISAEFAGAGARPLSMGRAFIGLADDSTAAEFNPAGIRILRRPELAWQATHTFDRREVFLREESTLAREGVRGWDTNEWTTPSFISYVHPGQDYTWAVSQLTTIDFTTRYDDPARDPSNPFFTDLEVVNNSFGFTFATDIQPRLHIGATLRMNRYDLYYNDSLREFGQGIGPLEITDWSPSFNVGILWRKSKDWSYGAVYKSSQKIEHPLITTTELPETIGVGVAYHPNDKLRVLADVDYIPWSEFDSIPNDAFKRQDVVRYHVGMEYLFRQTDDEAWFVRTGFMRENANSLFYDPNSVNSLPAGSSLDRIYTSGFPKEDDINHISFGLGLAREKYQIDFAIDHAFEGQTVLILSMIHYF